MNTPITQAGWYPDPDDGSKVRWWDGNSWSGFVGPANTTLPDLPAPTADIAVNGAVDGASTPATSAAAPVAVLEPTSTPTPVIPTPVIPTTAFVPTAAPTTAVGSPPVFDTNRYGAYSEEIRAQFVHSQIVVALAALAVLAALLFVIIGGSDTANDGALVFAIVVVASGLFVGAVVPYMKVRARKLQVDNARDIRIARSAGADWAGSARPAVGRELQLAGLPHGKGPQGLGAFRAAFRPRGLLSVDLTGMHYRAPNGEAQMWPFATIDHVELRFEPEVGTVCLIVSHDDDGNGNHGSTRVSRVFPVSLWDPDYSVGADMLVQLGHVHIITIDSRNLGPRWSGLREE